MESPKASRGQRGGRRSGRPRARRAAAGPARTTPPRTAANADGCIIARWTERAAGAWWSAGLYPPPPRRRGAAAPRYGGADRGTWARSETPFSVMTRSGLTAACSSQTAWMWSALAEQLLPRLVVRELMFGKAGRGVSRRWWWCWRRREAVVVVVARGLDVRLRLALLVLEGAVEQQDARLLDAAAHLAVDDVLVDHDALEHAAVLHVAARDLLDLGVALDVDRGLGVA